MPAKPGVFLINLGEDLGKCMRAKVFNSPHYKDNTDFIKRAVEEKIKREFIDYETTDSGQTDNRENEPPEFKKVPASL